MKSISTRSARVAASAALFALIILQSASAAVKPGVTYPGGTKVETPGTGVSFTIPAGWSGILPSGGTFFVMGSKAQKSYIFVLVDKMTTAKAMENMGNPLSLGNGLTLEPVGEIRKKGDMLFASYSVKGGKQPLKGYIETRLGDGDLGVGYVAISAPETAADVRKVVHQLTEATTMDKP